MPSGLPASLAANGSRLRPHSETLRITANSHPCPSSAGGLAATPSSDKMSGTRCRFFGGQALLTSDGALSTKGFKRATFRVTNQQLLIHRVIHTPCVLDACSIRRFRNLLAF